MNRVGEVCQLIYKQVQNHARGDDDAPGQKIRGLFAQLSSEEKEHVRLWCLEHLIRVLELRYGDAETLSIGCLIARHDIGFISVEGALRHFAGCLARGLESERRDALEQQVRERKHEAGRGREAMPEKPFPELTAQAAEERIIDLIRADNQTGSQVVDELFDHGGGWDLWCHGIARGEFDYRVVVDSAEFFIAAYTEFPNTPEAWTPIQLPVDLDNLEYAGKAPRV